MPTVEELIVSEELAALTEIAGSHGWDFDGGSVIGMRARDGSMFWLKLDHAGYPKLPASWRWYNPITCALDQPADAPTGSSFWHSSGRICAPWNRHAYKQIDEHGPHGDWDLMNWMSNPQTGKCTTLAAMALRIFVELSSDRHKGRLG